MSMEEVQDRERELTDARAQNERLRWALQNILNGINTGSVRIDTDEDETWANAMHKARKILGEEPC